MKQTHPFDPIVDGHSRVLILGSFPSLKSFENNFYYAHPRNQFWPIMAALFDTVLEDNDARRAFALEHGIAMWDVYGALRRSRGNSSDANLSDLLPNDIPALLKQHPKIHTVFCTGRKAYDGLKKAFPGLDAEVRLLPSTSPAYAAMKFEEKLEAYRAVRDALG
jgi:TDG/mug DNA glycosylase family protein